MPAMIHIDRCVCADRCFASLLAEARERSLSLEQLSARCGAGDGCQMCLPYLREAMRTGQTVFHELLPAEQNPRSLS